MKNLLLLILVLFSLFVLLALAALETNMFLPDLTPKTETVHNMVVEKMEGMGKMELVKYQFKDIVKHEQVIQWFPDPTVLLIVVGEAVGCIDLAQIDSTDVMVKGDTIYVSVPEPEFCYVKIDHQQSKVYETWYTYWDEAEMVDEAYRLAEQEIEKAAYQANVLDNTRIQADLVLRPMLEAITNKTVILKFPDPAMRVE